jgi:hypothetical protein
MAVSYFWERDKMASGRPALLKLTFSGALLIAAFPAACAVGVEPGFDDEPNQGQAGSTAEGGGGQGGSGVLPIAGTTTTSSGGKATNPFGGTSSSGGSTAGGGGAAGGGGKAGSSSGGAGTAGSAGSGGAATGGGGGAGGGGAGCACPKTLTWVDNMVLNWVSGDCLTVAGKTYLYTGTKAQTYANGQCNPTKQEPWCTSVDGDYKFMACN